MTLAPRPSVSVTLAARLARAAILTLVLLAAGPARAQDIFDTPGCRLDSECVGFPTRVCLQGLCVAIADAALGCTVDQDCAGFPDVLCEDGLCQSVVVLADTDPSLATGTASMQTVRVPVTVATGSSGPDTSAGVDDDAGCSASGLAPRALDGADGLLLLLVAAGLAVLPLRSRPAGRRRSTLLQALASSGPRC